MKIRGSNEIANDVNRQTFTETRKVGDGDPGLAGSPVREKEGAIVSLSQRSKDVQKVQAAIEAEPEIRLDKVRAIKEKIEQGTYEVNFEATADKMIQSLLDDNL